MAAYTNAAYAWAMVNALDEARAKLLEAQAADRACADALRDLLAHPPQPPARDDTMSR